MDDHSIDEAIGILHGKFNEELKNIDGLIFLTYKPKGRANPEQCLTMDNRLQTFIAAVDTNKCVARIGFDACFVPVLMRFTDVDVDYIDSCECGFFRFISMRR